MQIITNVENGPSWLLEISGRLLILGWFTLAGVAFGLLCGIVVVRSATRREKSLTLGLAA